MCRWAYVTDPRFIVAAVLSIVLTGLEGVNSKSNCLYVALVLFASQVEQDAVHQLKLIRIPLLTSAVMLNFVKN
jgi:hypothetical protein